MHASSSRREFLRNASIAAAAVAAPHIWIPRVFAFPLEPPLAQFDYADVSLASELHSKQLHETHAVLMELSEDSLLKPLRKMAGQPAPGEELGGWYLYNPDYDRKKSNDGFAPGATFGQWVSSSTLR